MKLAEGDIGEVEELPEDAQSAINPNIYRIRPTGQDSSLQAASASSSRAPAGRLGQQVGSAALAEHSKACAMVPAFFTERSRLWPPGQAQDVDTGSSGAAAVRIKFTDKDEHMYFWFPLLAGLSELTFDPRRQIRLAGTVGWLVAGLSPKPAGRCARPPDQTPACLTLQLANCACAGTQA